MNLLTCLMTTYNENRQQLEAALESILNQTYDEFDFLIIVDNSDNQEILSVLESYAEKDNRIRYVINEKNMGLPMALNRGIDMIQTKYIARMDADDIAFPQRFKKQIQYLEQHPDVALVGAFCTCIDENGNPLHTKTSRPFKSKQINQCMKYMNVFTHPTFMGKTAVFKKMKYRNLRYAQDYDFTCRLIESGCKLENIPEVLLKYRIISNVSESKIVRQRVTGYYIQKYFRKGILIESDIIHDIEDELQQIDAPRTAEAIQKSNAGFRYLHKHQYFKGISVFWKSMISSKYQREYISGLAIYSALKKIYQF